MSRQFRDFRDLVCFISQELSSDQTRELAYREGLPDSLHEEKQLIVLKYMINQQIIGENKLKEFEAALKGINRKDLAEHVRKFQKKKKAGPSVDRNPISEFEKLNLHMGTAKFQAHLTHIHVQQLLQLMERRGSVPHQAFTELRETVEKCADVCKSLKSVAKACAVSSPDECGGSDDDCSSTSSTLSNRGNYTNPCSLSS